MYEGKGYGAWDGVGRCGMYIHCMGGMVVLDSTELIQVSTSLH